MILTKPCKLITKSLDSHGYPWGWHDGRYVNLCRVALEEKLERPIRDSYFCCHHCDTPNCVEPEHLFEGTPSQNSKDASDKGRLNTWGDNNLKKTHCPKGHEYTESNTRVHLGQRYCRACNRARPNRNKSRFATK